MLVFRKNTFKGIFFRSEPLLTAQYGTRLAYISAFSQFDYFPAMKYGAIRDMLLMMISSQEVSFD